jgi:putative flippase GtrA
MRAPVLIPAYEPGPALLDTVQALLALGFQRIVVVNDGSSAACDALFAALPPETQLLRHAVNLGKGAALKTGLNHILLKWPDCPGAVTADADGQHSPDDIARVAAQLQQQPNALVLGARQFDHDVPFRSLLGNRASALLMKALVGTRLTDTQTGLRGIPASLARQLLRLPTTGYEFELDMLLAAKHGGVPMVEVPIRTIYLDGNASSHFNPLWDSMRIYFVLLRFTAASVVTALIDNVVFALVYRASADVLLSQALGRCFAMVFNYAAARRAVFQSRERHAEVLPKYLLLVLVNAAISYGLITLIHAQFGGDVIVLKLLVEAGLFLANFAIQRDFVFSRRKDTATATDWTRYYSAVPPTARLTRRYSGRTLVRMLRTAGLQSGAHWVEFGGANSCFYDRLTAEFAPAVYEVIDTNRRGLDLLAERARDQALLLRQESILETPEEADSDIVFSAGLVEHFHPADTSRAIAAHFQRAKPGALVLITFPTPTLLYRATRALLEAAGLWQFPDERPLQFSEVLDTVKQKGQVLQSRILWPLILTQGVIVARKHPER